MIRQTLMSFIMMLALAVSGSVYAQDAEETVEGDDTMTVVEDTEEPADFENELALPEDASEEGVENSAYGLETANQAREMGREFGQERAAEARENSRDESVRENIGQQRAEQGQQNAP